MIMMATDPQEPISTEKIFRSGIYGSNRSEGRVSASEPTIAELASADLIRYLARMIVENEPPPQETKTTEKK